MTHLRSALISLEAKVMDEHRDIGELDKCPCISVEPGSNPAIRLLVGEELRDVSLEEDWMPLWTRIEQVIEAFGYRMREPDEGPNRIL